MVGSDTESSQLGPFVKPKPGKKPKAASYELPRTVAKAASANTQAKGRSAYGTPAPEQQKLTLCKYFEQGECQRGAGCWFAHGRDELRNPSKHASRQQAHAPKQQHQQHQQHQALDEQEQCPDEALFKTRMCTYFQQGRCQRGNACTFAHDPSELQAYNPARRYTHQAQSSPAHTLDRYLPQKLQEQAAAAAAAQETITAKSEKRIDRPAADKGQVQKERAPQSRPSPVALPPPYVGKPATSAPPNSQSYITPMPTGINAKHAVLQQEVNGNGTQWAAKGHKFPIESSEDIGHIEQGMEFLNMDGVEREADDDLEAPSSFCCPITTELLKEPVVAADGHTYERDQIYAWLLKSNTSPMTNERMEHNHLIPNLALRAVMDAYFGSRAEAVQ